MLEFLQSYDLAPFHFSLLALILGLGLLQFIYAVAHTGETL